MKQEKQSRFSSLGEILQLIAGMQGVMGLSPEAERNDADVAYRNWLMDPNNPSNQRYAAEAQGQQLSNSMAFNQLAPMLLPENPMTPPQEQLRRQAQMQALAMQFAGIPMDPLEMFEQDLNNLPR
jgi:hypothetical protein